MTKEQVIRLVYNEFRVLKTFKNKIFMWENWLKLVMRLYFGIHANAFK